MSLLMDALKRAEKARQAQASDAASGPPLDPAETQGLTLDPLEMSRPLTDDEPQAPADTPDASVTATHRLERPEDEALAGGEGLSMEPLDETFPQTPAPRGAGRGDPPPDPDRMALEDVAIDDTAATLPSLKAAQASVDDYFDGTRSVSMSMERADLELEPGATTITAERNAVRPDRDAVRAVFGAKAPSPRATRQWASAGFLVLVLLAVVSGGVFLFWTELSELVGGQPAVVARKPFSLESGAPAAGAAPAAGVDTEQPVVAAAASTAPAAVAAAGPAAEASPAPGAGEVATSGGVGLDDPALEAPSVSEILDTRPQISARTARPVEAAPAPAPASAPAAVARAPAAASDLPLALQPGMLRDGGLGAGSISISRRSTPARVPPLLERGYRAYQSGDDEGARSAYQQVLAKDPNNRDAALGLAAVSVRAGQWEAAHQLYMAVLSRNPRDSLAMTGLLALTENVDPGAAESRVKTLLGAEPNGAHLHFALGNLYARQERWPEAQEAYFNAWRNDEENADYAFNLAVSLDKLRQGQTALEYYRLALDLATRRPVSFDTASVSERIRNIVAGES